MNIFADPELIPSHILFSLLSVSLPKSEGFVR